ncbi:MAG: alanine--tRNA ligase [Planctomycetota bacterium]|jgi:alanyl-tRNA synthetase
MDRSAAAVRRAFIDFFVERHGHTFMPSSPVVPHEDPTLLFTNAGMNQFKDVFLGTGTREATRVVNSQKCIRAGGKHNDLEDVGRDTYHHTFFEMLGNWSFGDYFKAEAIDWAWELLTEVWGLDPSRLHATVFGGDAEDGLAADEEAEALWLRHLPREHVTRHGRKDNFWEMGDTGPCGPCSELHYDGTPDGTGGGLVNADDPRVIEVWNLVFIQFNRGDGGRLAPLPARHVDTGMGFERILRVLQGAESNYDTDLWAPIFEAIRGRTGVRPYAGDMKDPVDVAYRVLADHVRCLSVAIADGAPPSNEGRGYVLRRILRRAVRHAHQTLGASEPVLHELVPAVVATLGGAFPEIAARQTAITETIHDEEESFLRTLDRGIALFDEAAGRAAGGVIAAEDAFRLHDTFGFPVDLTRVMAEERDLAVDEPGYERLMEEAREQSRAGAGGAATRLGLPPDALGTLATMGVRPTVEKRREGAQPVMARVEAIWNGRDFDTVAHVGATVGLVFNESNHYAEAGGQEADHGHFLIEEGPHAPSEFHVEDVRRFGDYILHVGKLQRGKVAVGDEGTLTVEHARRSRIEPNHTATHLLNHALRTLVHEEADQKGSLVAPDRLRFDYGCPHAPTPEQLAEVEARVEAAIGEDLPVFAELAPLDAARAINGLRAVFGERYPDPVRVVSVGTPVGELLADPARDDWRMRSVEFCGGTHVRSTAAIGRFVIAQEGALASGIRRITALTGAAAQAAHQAADTLATRLDEADGLADAAVIEAFDEIQAAFETMTLGVVARHRLAPRVESLRDRVRGLRKAAAASARGDVVERAREIAERAIAAGGSRIVERIDGADKDAMLAAVDVLKARCPEHAVMLFSVDEEAGKVLIVAVVPPALLGRGLKAGDWVRVAATACGGGGGGRPDMAQAGGKDPARVPEAMDAAVQFARAALG